MTSLFILQSVNTTSERCESFSLSLKIWFGPEVTAESDVVEALILQLKPCRCVHVAAVLWASNISGTKNSDVTRPAYCQMTDLDADRWEHTHRASRPRLQPAGTHMYVDVNIQKHGGRLMLVQRCLPEFL